MTAQEELTGYWRKMKKNGGGWMGQGGVGGGIPLPIIMPAGSVPFLQRSGRHRFDLPGYVIRSGIRILLYSPVTRSGFFIIVAGLLLAFHCRSQFLRNRTTMSPYESPAVLITTGPFRFSRNPAYLAMAAILFGSAVVKGTLASFVFPVLFIVIIEVLFIPDEERKLDELFGGEYREYTRKVRQWV